MSKGTRGDRQDNATSSVAGSSVMAWRACTCTCAEQNSQLLQVAWFLMGILVGRPGYLMTLLDPAEQMQRQYCFLRSEQVRSGASLMP